MKKVLAAFLLALVAAVAAAAWFYARARAPYKGFTGEDQFVEIPQGAGSRTIGDRLVQAGVVRDRPTFRFALWMTGEGRRLKAGEYRFDRAMTPAEVIDKMARGDVFVIHVTFPEGLTSFEMARIFEQHGLGTAASFVDAAKDPSLVRSIDPDATTLEGYLFPETYAVPRRTDAAKLVRLMVTQFERAWTPELRAAAAARHLTPHQAITLASIVEKETAQATERPTVAAVYENRLRIGMPLQCDPTVIYALELDGRYDGNIHKQDLSIDSPYNTYRYPGLPPGPIASPGRASLDAAVHPADSDYLYFVSRNDGTHVFSRTLDEHNRNVQKFQVEYFRPGGAGKAGGPGRGGRGGS
jgi:peptidoglycan lytic transglycosylase G